MALLTPDLVEYQTLGRVSADTPGLSEVLERAENAVIRYCEWHVAPARDETLILDGSGTGLVQLPSLKVNEIQEVRQLGQVVPPEAYDWSATGQIQLRNPSGRWTGRYRGIQVDLNHGYDELPADLVNVILGLVVRAVASPMGEIMVRVGDRQSQFGSSAGSVSPLDLEYQVLSRYRARVA